MSEFQRRDLLSALSLAAQIEHLACVAYLFTASTLRRAPDGLSPKQQELVRRWRGQLLQIARQEMEHLGTTCNLLVAIGGSTMLNRGNLPTHQLPGGCDHPPLQLLPFGAEALGMLIAFESPYTGDLPDDSNPPDPDDSNPPDPFDLVPHVPRYNSVAMLWSRIESMFSSLEDEDESILFIGPPKSQISNADMGLPPSAGYEMNMVEVTNRATAQKAIERIRTNGEGHGNKANPASGEAPWQMSHYDLLCRIQEEYTMARAEDPCFHPSLPVVPNPYYRDTPREGTPLYREITRTELTYPLSIRVAQLLDSANEALMLLLVRFFSRQKSAKEVAVLRATAFFPMMTMVIRPLTEILTELPAQKDGGALRAGAPFWILPDLTPLQHSQSAHTVLSERLDRMAAAAVSFAAEPDAPARLRYVAESLTQIAWNYSNRRGDQ